MLRFVFAVTVFSVLQFPLKAQDIESLAGRKVVFLGDSITQAGGYVAFLTYFLEQQFPQKNFDFYGLGLASETVSGLSEENHAGGAFPRPCLHERLGRLLERVKPDVVIACYGMNDGIYKPLDPERFDAFKNGILKLIEDSQKTGAKEVFLVTPPIYDLSPKPGEFNYDSMLTAYAAWEMSLKLPGVQMIDLHTAMRQARDARSEPFSTDRVHPGDDGQLLIAKTILGAFRIQTPPNTVAEIQAEELFKLVDEKRRLRSSQWMNHIGYTREKTVAPQPLGDTELQAAKIQEKIDLLKRQ
ncbi:MAG: lipolytic enzyme [Planctomycetaceae bacterium]|nr:lipolytic enzyme [Planctomycetaceae bacterium]